MLCAEMLCADACKQSLDVAMFLNQKLGNTMAKHGSTENVVYPAKRLIFQCTEL